MPAGQPGIAIPQLPNWPTAQAPLGPATFKTTAQDFRVIEQPLPAPQMGRSDAAGSHAQRLFEIEKIGLNSHAVARLLAQWAKVPEVEIGYAGRKDRWGVTRQWFSVPAMACRDHDDPDQNFASYVEQQSIEQGSLRVLGHAWQPRKLRVGELAGNQFTVRLHLQRPVNDLALQSMVTLLGRSGAPNYFGPQRFGFDNLPRAVAWLQARVRDRQHAPARAGRNRRRPGQPRSGAKAGHGMHLSTLRAFLFNQVLAARVRAGSHTQLLDGDCADAGVPTGPLWGRGRSKTAGLAAQIEHAALDPFADLLHGLEFAGASQMRRPLAVVPEELHWQRHAEQLQLSFQLPKGAYATTLLAELFTLDDASRRQPGVAA